MMRENTDNQRYKILWIDDEYERQDAFRIKARKEGIDLVCYTSQEEGMAELKQNYQYYDGVLLDVICFMHKADKPGEEMIEAFYEAKNELITLGEKKKFELFVLTGQEQLFKDDNFKRSLHPHQDCIYRKGTNDVFGLLNDMKAAADQQPETQLRHQYAEAFAACKGDYLGKSAPGDLMALLKWFANKPNASEIDPLTSIRKILESLNQQLQHQGLVPETLTLNQCARFLCGKEYKYRFANNPYHPTATFIFASLVDLTQDASHAGSTDTLRLKVNTFMTHSTHLAQGAIHQLLDILAWFGDLLANNTSKSDNLNTWEENWQEVEVSDMKPNGWGAFSLNSKSIGIPKAKVNELSLQKGDKVRVIVKPETKHMIDKIEKV